MIEGGRAWVHLWSQTCPGASRTLPIGGCSEWVRPGPDAPAGRSFPAALPRQLAGGFITPDVARRPSCSSSSPAAACPTDATSRAFRARPAQVSLVESVLRALCSTVQSSLSRWCEYWLSRSCVLAHDDTALLTLLLHRRRQRRRRVRHSRQLKTTHGTVRYRSLARSLAVSFRWSSRAVRRQRVRHRDGTPRPCICDWRPVRSVRPARVDAIGGP